MRPKLFFLTPFFLKGAECEYLEIEEDQAHFIQYNDPTAKLFHEQYWYLHTPDLFKRMAQEHAHALLLHLASAKVNQQGSSWADFEWENPDKAKRLFREIRVEDIEMVKTKGVCRYLGLGLDLNPAAFAGAHKRCAIELMQLALLRPLILEALPATIFENYPELIAVVGAKIVEINPDSLRTILESGKICKYIPAELVAQLDASAITEMVRPQCFARLANLSTVDFTNLAYFSPEIATKVDTKLTQSTMFHLTKEQVAALNQDGFACRHVNLEEISHEAASGMGGRCLAAFFQAVPAAHFPRLRDLWRRFETKALVDALRIDVRIVKTIHPKDYQELLSDMMNAIFRLPEACSLIVKEAQLPIEDKTSINSLCFANLHPRLQPFVLLKHPKPPADLLSRVDAKMMSDWVYLKGNSTVLRGFQVIRLAQNAAKLIEKLSSEAREHACRSIPNAPTLLHDKVFPYHITDACFRNLSFQLRPHECKKVPRLWILQNREHIVRGTATGQEEVYPFLSEDDMKLLVGFRGFCKNLNYVLFRMLSEVAKQNLSKPCFYKLTFKNQLAADDFNALSASIVEDLDYATSKDVNIDSIPNDLLQRLSKNALKGSSALRRLPPDAFLNWDSTRIASLDPKQWVQVPPEAFASFSPFQMTAIPMEALEYWCRNQITRLRKECLKELTAEQLQRLGVKVDANALKAINPELFPKNSTRYRLLKAKQRYPWIKISIGALLLLGLGAGAFLWHHSGLVKTIFKPKFY